MLPEYLFENVAEYIEFLSRYDADALDNADKDILITFTIVFLSPGYVNNPFLKAKLVQVSSPSRHSLIARAWQTDSFHRGTGERGPYLTGSTYTAYRHNT